MPYVIQYPTGQFRTKAGWTSPTPDLGKAKVFKRRGDATLALGMDAGYLGAAETRGIGTVREVALTLVDTIAHAEVDEWLRTNPAGVAPGAAQP